MRKRGFGRKYCFAIAAFVLAISVAAPELSAPAGAAPARGANRVEMARAAVKRKKAPKHPLTAAKRKALLSQYFKTHPGAVARKLGVSTAVARRRLAKRKQAKKTKPLAHKPPKKKKRVTRRQVRTAKRQVKKAKRHTLGVTGWTEVFLLALLPFGVVGGLLLGTDYARRPREPRAPSPSKRRRTLVITPMKGRR